MSARKCIILIDGSNFYFKLKDIGLHDFMKLNFAALTKMLAGKNEIVNCIFYIGKVKTDGSVKSTKMQAKQQQLFAHLKKNHVQYSLGYLLKADGKFHEKGVDVNIAVDILVAAYENLCEHVILISSDTDLLPAIRKAKEKEKTVEYIGFSHQPSLAMVANCSESRLLKKEDILPFVK